MEGRGRGAKDGYTYRPSVRHRRCFGIGFIYNTDHLGNAWAMGYKHERKHGLGVEYAVDYNKSPVKIRAL